MTTFDKTPWEERQSGSTSTRPHSEFRSAANRDRARVIHSAAFRRLQAKTQVLGIGEGDFHRTRLTHSMEAGQIARGIARALQEGKTSTFTAEYVDWLPNQNQIETIALAHDLGHPPFGHGGEIALNYVMRAAGGFEGNGQTLRLLARLEAHTENHGLDLTRRSLLGILKYPVPYSRVVRTQLPTPVDSFAQVRRDDWKPPKCFHDAETDIVDWVLAPLDYHDRVLLTSLLTEPTDVRHGKAKFHAFDTSIMELGDDIAYGVHDLEDAIALRMLTLDDWQSVEQAIDVTWEAGMGLSRELYQCLFKGSSAERKQAVGALVNAFIVSSEVYKEMDFGHPLLRFQARLTDPATRMLDAMKELVVRKVIKTPQVQTIEYRGQQIVMKMYEALMSDPPRLLKENFAAAYSKAIGDPARHRVVCDYIAGMTDEYATRMYERLFVPRHGHVFDRL